MVDVLNGLPERMVVLRYGLADAEPKTLEGMSQEETDGTKLLPGAVEEGAYEYHREGLRRGSKCDVSIPSRAMSCGVSRVRSTPSYSMTSFAVHGVRA